MADVDEDAIHPVSSGAGLVDIDLSDETQDFRFLNSLSVTSDVNNQSLPRRGDKDFEPNPTLLQSDVLNSSRQAMHNALAYTRLHNPKKIVIGIYAPDGFAPPSQPSPAINPRPCGAKIVDAAQDEKDPKNGSIDNEKQRRTHSALTRDLRSFRDVCVYVTNPKGQFFQTMGQADRWGRVWLLPEEALYLLERGSVDIRWPTSISGAASSDDDCGKTGEVEEEELGIPMSLQGAYTYFIGRGGLTLERFNVFTGLKRLGYTILRAPTWYDDTEAGALGESSLPQSRPDAKTTGLFGSVWSLFGFIWNTKGVKRPSYPLIGLGIYSTYSDIYRRLALIPAENPALLQSTEPKTSGPYRIAFHVYKPSTPFKKSAPPKPDFQIAVIDSRTDTNIPSLVSLRGLLESTPYSPLKGEKAEKNIYLRLKHGKRSVILAVVDQGVISYLRVADAGFSKEKLYLNESRFPMNKRSGHSVRGRGNRDRGR